MKAYNIAKRYRGIKVGRGECTDIAQMAAEKVGAKPWYKQTKSGSNFYMWGKPTLAISADRNIRKGSFKVGQILQFKMRFKWDTSDGGSVLRG